MRMTMLAIGIAVFSVTGTKAQGLNGDSGKKWSVGVTTGVGLSEFSYQSNTLYIRSAVVPIIGVNSQLRVGRKTAVTTILLYHSPGVQTARGKYEDVAIRFRSVSIGSQFRYAFGRINTKPKLFIGSGPAGRLVVDPLIFWKRYDLDMTGRNYPQEFRKVVFGWTNSAGLLLKAGSGTITMAYQYDNDLTNVYRADNSGRRGYLKTQSVVLSLTY